MESAQGPLNMSIQARRQRSKDLRINLDLPNNESRSQHRSQSDYTPIGPVDRTYVFVWSEVTFEESRGPDARSCMRIRSTNDDPEPDGYYICWGRFIWGTFEADFTCLYHPDTDAFTEFEVVEDSMEGGMEDIKEIYICFESEQESRGEPGQGGSSAIKDDDGNEFMFVSIEFGSMSGGARQSGYIIGKVVLPGTEMGDVDLSVEERVRLELDGGGEEDDDEAEAEED